MPTKSGKWLPVREKLLGLIKLKKLFQQTLVNRLYPVDGRGDRGI